MHWSLLQEMVRNELGDAPEILFDKFDQQAFAAASLGQVHRATLKTGDDVVLKIQYPGVARAISDDLRNLLMFLLPSRLTTDWQSIKGQFDELRSQFGWRSIFDRLKAQIDVRPIAEQEVKAAKWDRVEDASS